MQQEDLSILLTQIAQNQTVDSEYFKNGLFASYRNNPIWLYSRPDSNLFFTAISAFTLQRLTPLLTPAERLLSDAISSRAVGVYPRFSHKDGLGTYNFYATDPPAHFPHGWLMHRFRHFKLPDDIDDTAMVYLTTKPTPDDLDCLTKKLAQHANLSRLTVQATFPDYRHLRAYSTWFGQAMPIEFDACAMANMLYLVHEHGLPIDVPARDSLTFLADIVQTDRYRTDPFRCSHNYARTCLIQYHLARLISAHNPAPLRVIRAKLIADMQAAFTNQLSRLDQVVLGTSLLRLGQPVPPIDLAGIESEFAGYSFFIAGLLSAYPTAWVYRWAHHPFWHIRWRCDDHCRVLLLEYLVLSRAAR